ncbi:MAG: FAD-binding protein [Candidatus Tectomicrobia bacterium]|uniref:FAD-binding protein n=1 Tax=Tectimicrobiota bacterium TaxID=2528274 RepID=A0A933LRS5_UNCTE|nr:FAD-binding protein [Candidatus Tectomicrobia bacterium]
MTLSSDIITNLKSIVGTANFSDSQVDKICYSYDATTRKFQPDAVIQPENALQISEILKLANIHEFPVIPRGAGSGFSGGSLAVEGGIVLDMTRMNRIISINKQDLLAIVEPGVVTGDFQKQVEALGLFYPPDPSSLKFCTMGGNVAEGAGGPRAMKYGVTGHYVLGLEVVFPEGEITRIGRQTVKGVAGYDLTSLMVGSEGTLGVITKIWLRLLPMPRSSKTMLLVFRELAQAGELVAKIIALGIIPCTLELMDREAMQCVEEYARVGFPEAGEASLLIEVDGTETAVREEAQRILELAGQAECLEIRQARNEQEREALWLARRSISPALRKLGPTKFNEDVVVPRSRIPLFLVGLRELASKYSLKMVNFGHAGDGNIHVNIMTDERNLDEMKRVHLALEDLFRLTIEMEGTITGEHGVGITKAPYLKWETGDIALGIMRKLKGTLDPKGILNPGKIFIK